MTGRPQLFFAATAPGLESLCREELTGLTDTIGEVRIEPGGVAFGGRVTDGFRANLHLRTANRILMRIGSFKATNFRQLERQLAKIDWELFLPAGCRPEIRVTVHQCRLYHDAAIAERVERSVAARLVRFVSVGGQGASSLAPAPDPQRIFVLGTHDRFEVSLDSSGTLLYKRGIKQQVGRAPLRETLAAGALTLAGFDPGEPLIDPMCGSGTFSIEAAMRALNLAPGWYRDFAFMQWPCFKAAQWAHIRQQAQAQIETDTKAFIFASDLDRQPCERLAEQLKRFEIGAAVRVACRDFFTMRPDEVMATEGIAGPGLVAINPPYGRRLRPSDSDPRNTFFDQLAAVLTRRYRSWKLALIAPPHAVAAFRPLKLKPRSLHHGGLKLTLLTGRIK